MESGDQVRVVVWIMNWWQQGRGPDLASRRTILDNETWQRGDDAPMATVLERR